MLDLAKFFSLILTPVHLVVTAAVIVIFVPAAGDALRSKVNGGAFQRDDLLLLGIVVGFIGKFLDNLYWAVPWSLSFVGAPSAADWHANGVAFNILFRQEIGRAHV